MYKNITKEDIEREYVNIIGISGRQASKKLGISYKIFLDKLKLHNISFKKRNSKYEILNNKDWLYQQYVTNKRSIKEISEDIGCTKGVVHSSLKWAKIPRRTVLIGLSNKFPNGRFGKNASNWKGGKRKGGKDLRYNMILKPEHPQADSSGYIMEHRLVMEEKIGRYLTKEEIVHHLDGNGNNNEISNLELTTRKKHFQNHFEAVKYIKEKEEENIRLKKLLKENNIDF